MATKKRKASPPPNPEFVELIAGDIPPDMQTEYVKQRTTGGVVSSSSNTTEVVTGFGNSLILNEGKRGPGGRPAADIPPAQKEAADDEARHAPDFRSVFWFGKTYTFTPKQAACVKLLWEAWENKTPDVGQTTILAGAEDALDARGLGEQLTRGARFVDVFKQSGAWQKMIVPGQKKGTVRLQEPR